MLAADTTHSTTTTLAISPSSTYQGVQKEVSLTATVTYNKGALVPNKDSSNSGNEGHVSFTLDGASIGAVATVNGVASFKYNVGVNNPGSLTFGARYHKLITGKGNDKTIYDNSPTAIQNFEVKSPESIATQTNLEVSRPSALLGSGDPVTLTATVTHNGTARVPNHSRVVFYVDEDISTGITVNTVNGVATTPFNVSGLGANGHTFKAVYLGSSAPVVVGDTSYKYEPSTGTVDFTIIGDTLAPTTNPQAESADPNNYPGPNSAGWYRGPVSLQFNVTDDTGLKLLRYQIDKQSSVGGPVTQGSEVVVPINNLKAFTYILPQPLSGDGIYTVYYSAEDFGNNVERCTSQLYKKLVIKIDGTKPVITVPATQVVEATSTLGAVVNFPAPTAVDTVSGSLSVLGAPTPGSTFALGSHTFTVEATDPAGNTAAKSFSITVQDTTAPVITPPANITGVEATGPNGAVVTFSASATDAVDSAVSVNASPASGSTFPLGTTTITLTASDAAGNAAKSVTFTVTVVDTTAPVITPPANITGVEATGPNGAVVTFSASAVDLVDGAVQVNASPASGSVFGLGKNTVNLTATDAAGNAANASFTVEVVDTKAPDLTIPADIRLTAAKQPDGSTGAAASFKASATDLVDGTVRVSFTVNGTTVDSDSDVPVTLTFPVGISTVTVKATDASGNCVQKSFNVSVAYAWSGVLQPVNADGTSSFKLGSTIPVKFQLSGASAGISNGTFKLYVTKAPDVAATSVNEAVSTSAADSGNTFRYDSTSGQYVFNLSTKVAPLGTEGVYYLRIDLGDGATSAGDLKRTVKITIRK